MKPCCLLLLIGILAFNAHADSLSDKKCEPPLFYIDLVTEDDLQMWSDYGILSGTPNLKELREPYIGSLLRVHDQVRPRSYFVIRVNFSRLSRLQLLLVTATRTEEVEFSVERGVLFDGAPYIAGEIHVPNEPFFFRIEGQSLNNEAFSSVCGSKIIGQTSVENITNDTSLNLKGKLLWITSTKPPWVNGVPRHKQFTVPQLKLNRVEFIGRGAVGADVYMEMNVLGLPFPSSAEMMIGGQANFSNGLSDCIEAHGCHRLKFDNVEIIDEESSRRDFYDGLLKVRVRIPPQETMQLGRKLLPNFAGKSWCIKLTDWYPSADNCAETEDTIYSLFFSNLKAFQNDKKRMRREVMQKTNSLIGKSPIEESASCADIVMRLQDLALRSSECLMGCADVGLLDSYHGVINSFSKADVECLHQCGDATFPDLVNGVKLYFSSCAVVESKEERCRNLVGIVVYCDLLTPDQPYCLDLKRFATENCPGLMDERLIGHRLS